MVDGIAMKKYILRVSNAFQESCNTFFDPLIL
jgi:hypothetical protein